MRLAMRFVLVVCITIFPLEGWGQGSPLIPSRSDPAWNFLTPKDSSQAAPSGYEGRTDTSIQSAVTRATDAPQKRFDWQFTLGNQIQTCPNADGTVEGTGKFSMSINYNDGQGGTWHTDVTADAKYKGQVGDDALLKGPVNAEIDYSYVSSGRIRQNGALVTPAGANIKQHITMPIMVPLKAMGIPDIGAPSGGDPLGGHYAQAAGTGLMLSYWAGVYYSIAQMKWYGGDTDSKSGKQGICVDVAFDPPSNTTQPPFGTETKVKAMVKTKGGEIVKGHFFDAHIYSEVDNNSNAGSVSPSGGNSDVAGSPMQFIYTAPNRKLKDPGFAVGVFSRAGAAIGQWHTGLGTGWSGQVSCLVTHTGDAGGSESGSWSNFDVARFIVTVKDGVGTGSGFHQIKNVRISKRPVANYADPRHPNWADDGSSTTEGMASDSSKATVEVNIDKASGTYSIQVGTTPTPPSGKLQTSTCIPNHGCTQTDQPFGAGGCFPGIGGKLNELNELHGEMNDEKDGLGTAHNGKYIYNVRWDLARQGTTQK